LKRKINKEKKMESKIVKYKKKERNQDTSNTIKYRVGIVAAGKINHSIIQGMVVGGQGCIYQKTTPAGDIS
jgi:hypothetical protein